MKLVKADFILTCEDNMRIIPNGAVVFDEKIIEVGDANKLQEAYPDANVIDTEPQSIIMPGLINTHVHLEYSANKGSLRFGDFVPWLESVIKNRESLQASVTPELISKTIDGMIKSGTTTFGAISSFGLDMQECANCEATVVYFNEALGTKPDAIDALFADFKERLSMSEAHKSGKFIPAISIHSPYSTHHILAKHVLQIAKKKRMLVSTHFMESLAEREWLDGAVGNFRRFLEQFSKDPKPFYSADEFIEMFKGLKTLFIHVVCANEDELEIIKEQKDTIVHCGVSNRLLGAQTLNLERIEDKGINIALGTDGLS